MIKQAHITKTIEQTHQPGQDFVCTWSLASERDLAETGGRYYRNLVQRVLIAYFGIAVLLLLAILLYMGAAVVLNPTGRMLLSLAFVGLIGLPVVQLLRGNSFMPFPTNLRLEPSGLSLLWLDIKCRSHVIPWTAIKDVSVSNNMLNFKIDTGYTDISWLSVATETCGLWNGGLPFVMGAGKFNPAVLSLAFPLTSFTLDSDRPKFLASMQANIDDAQLMPSFKDCLVPSATPSYTQLWLDDLHSFNRLRTNELAVDSTLQEERYQVASIIGSGGQAKIYRVVDRRTGVQAVLKEVVLPLHGGIDMRERAFNSVKNEAVLLSKLSHPGIVKLIDHFVEDHRAYLVLENIEGQTLRQLVQTIGRLPVVKVQAIAFEICSILSYLHESVPAVLHRDLSPDNLIINETGKVTLIDFSVAQDVASTGSRTVVGKSNYIAPEQFKGSPTTQSDLYSLGATLFFLLTASDPVPISSSLPSDTLGAACVLDGLVLKLTQASAADRYATAREVMELPDLKCLEPS